MQQPGPAEPPVLQAIPAGLTPFAADETEQLELYRELVAELSDWEFANRQKVDLVIGPGGVLAEDIEKADLVALATTFRKLGWLEKEPASFGAKDSRATASRPARQQVASSSWRAYQPSTRLRLLPYRACVVLQRRPAQVRGAPSQCAVQL